jgi:hypothetical protein
MLSVEGKKIPPPTVIKEYDVMDTGLMNYRGKRKSLIDLRRRPHEHVTSGR